MSSQVPSGQWATTVSWLEIRSDHPEELETKIRAFGVFEIESAVHKKHLYFQAPGGQVYRIVKNGEDLSRFER